MRSNKKLLLLLAAVLGIGALSAGLALASGGSATQDTTPAAQADTGDDDAAAGGKDDDGAGEAEDDGTKDDDGSADEKDAEGTLTGEAAAQASDAALAVTGGGTVTAVESDDGDAGYEVEIRSEDGKETEVELDKSFQVVKRTEDD